MWRQERDGTMTQRARAGVGLLLLLLLMLLALAGVALAPRMEAQAGVRTVAFPHPPTDVAVDARTGHVFISVANRGSAGSVYVLDTRSARPVRTVAVGLAPEHL